MTNPTAQEMAAKFRNAYERLWWALSLLEPQEIDSASMPDGWPPKTLVGHVAAWNAIHTRRMIKVVRPEHLSFIERNNGGISTDEDIARLRARDAMRAAVDARLPLETVLEDLERTQEWTVKTLSDETGDLGKALAGENADPRLYAIYDEMLREMSDLTRALRRWVGSMQRWTKRDLLALLESQHELLMESIAGLDEATILSTITHAPWSMRDELVHVLAWNEFEWKIIEAWPNAQANDLGSWLRDSDESEDEVNERLAAERIDLNMIEVVDALATVHRRTIKRLEAADNAMLASEANWFFGAHGELSNFAFAMALHQAEHSEWLWKTRLALGK